MLMIFNSDVPSVAQLKSHGFISMGSNIFWRVIANSLIDSLFNLSAATVNFMSLYISA